MKKKQILFLLFIAPALAELLSGSSPPIEFFNPIGFVILVLLYGCGVLLIREAKSRWGLQWSFVFLAMAFAVFEEGVVLQSFFNPEHADLGNLSNYGILFGIQLPWAIMLIIFHSTLSVTVPILMADLLWPKLKNKAILSTKGIFLNFMGVVIFSALWFISMLNPVGTEISSFIDYQPNKILVVGSFLLVVGFVWLAYHLRDNRLENKGYLPSPFLIGVLSFLLQPVNFLFPTIAAEKGLYSGAVVLFQLIGILVFSTVLSRGLGHQKTTKEHKVAFVFGTLLFWIMFSPLLEFNGASGMSLVGFICLICLVKWQKKVLGRDVAGLI